ncbi:MAG: phage tail assembly protein T [Rickettsiales bacterium]
MPASLYSRWQDYSRIEPFGQPWENWLMSVPATMFKQVHSRKGTVVKMQDFTYEDEKSKRDREAADLMAFFDAFEPKQ